MTRSEALEILVGLLLVGAGLAYYVGWAPMAIVGGLFFVLGGVLTTIWRRVFVSRSAS